MLETPAIGKSITRDAYNPSFIKLGVFRKGSPKQEGKNKRGEPTLVMGKDLGDRFRFDPEIGDDYKKQLLKELITNILGSVEPTVIRAELMGETVDDVFYSFYTRHNSANKLLIQCTGRTILKEFCDRTKRLQSVNKPCVNQDDRLMHCQDCQPDSKLHIYIPELSQTTVELDDGTGYRFFGGLDVVTSSMSDGFHIASRLQGLQMMANSLGLSLQGLPVIITRKAEERSGVDRKPTKKEGGKTVPNPNFMKSFKKLGWFIEIELDTLRWAEKLQKRGIDSSFVLSPSNQLAIAPAQNTIAPAPDEISVKELFKQMLSDRNVDFVANGAFISSELYRIGYKHDSNNGRGDASKIPLEKLNFVVSHVAEGLEIEKRKQAIAAKTIQNNQPLKNAFDPDEATEYLEAIASEVE